MTKVTNALQKSNKAYSVPESADHHVPQNAEENVMVGVQVLPPRNKKFRQTNTTLVNTANQVVRFGSPPAQELSGHGQVLGLFGS